MNRLFLITKGVPRNFNLVLQCRRRNSTTSKSNGINFVRMVFLGETLELNRNQQKLQELTRTFVNEEVIHRAAELDHKMEFPWDIFIKAWSLGLLTGGIPEKYGGVNMGVLEKCIIVEEIAYGCSGVQVAIMGSGHACAPVFHAGTEEQMKKYFGMLTREPVIAAYATTEPSAGSDIGGLQMTAVRRDKEWILNGEKCMITGGGVATWITVLAKTDFDPNTNKSKALTFFVVDANTPGVIPGKKQIMLGQRCSDTMNIVFQDVILTNDNILGSVGSGFKLAMIAFDKNRPTAGAASIGIARRALDESIKYLNERESALCDQTVSHLLADMAVGIETSRLMVRRAAWEFDQGRRNSYYASIAKLFASDCANRSAADAVQILGLDGYSMKYPVEKLMRDAKVYHINGGASQVQKVVISRGLVGSHTKIV